MVGSSHFTLDTPSVSNHALKKVKLWDKVRALEVLARHFGVLKDQMEQRGVIELRWGERSTGLLVVVEHRDGVVTVRDAQEALPRPS